MSKLEILKIVVGSKVRVKADVNHSCPEGRVNNRTAVVSAVFGDVNALASRVKKDMVRVDRDLEGSLYWNIAEIEPVLDYADIFKAGYDLAETEHAETEAGASL